MNNEKTFVKKPRSKIDMALLLPYIKDTKLFLACIMLLKSFYFRVQNGYESALSYVVWKNPDVCPQDIEGLTRAVCDHELKQTILNYFAYYTEQECHQNDKIADEINGIIKEYIENARNNNESEKE